MKRVWGPKSERHPSVGLPCPVCGKRFRPGQMSALCPLPPKGHVRKEHQAGSLPTRWGNLVEVEVHAECFEDGLRVGLPVAA